MRTTLFAPGRPSWVQADITIFGEFGQIEHVDVLNAMPTSIIKHLRSLLLSNLCYFWFGSFRHIPYLILARLLGKKIVIVAGGYDVNALESIQYGAFSRNRISRLLRRLTFSFADTILAVSNFAREKACRNLQIDPTKIKTVYLGFLPPRTALPTWANRPMQVTFLISAKPHMFLVKGLDRIPELCKVLPHIQFKIAGSLCPEIESYLRSNQLDNLEILGWIPFDSDDFALLLGSSRIVCLPSRTETFGAALIDGAMHGCLPVGFGVGAIPEVLAEMGLVAKEEDVHALALLIQNALNQSDFSASTIQQKAIERFSLQHRSAAIFQVLLELGLKKPTPID